MDAPRAWDAADMVAVKDMVRKALLNGLFGRTHFTFSVMSVEWGDLGLGLCELVHSWPHWFIASMLQYRGFPFVHCCCLSRVALATEFPLTLA